MATGQRTVALSIVTTACASAAVEEKNAPKQREISDDCDRREEESGDGVRVFLSGISLLTTKFIRHIISLCLAWLVLPGGTRALQGFPFHLTA